MSVKTRYLVRRKSWVVNNLRVLVGGILLLGCLSGTDCVPEMPKECRQYMPFFYLSSEQRKSEFKSYPMQKQYDIYLCGMYRHPPHLELANYMANSDEAVIPFLIEKLKVENNENTQRDIIYIFKVMSERSNSLRGRQDIIDLIEKTVFGMKRAVIKERSQQMLDDIRNNTVK